MNRKLIGVVVALTLASVGTLLIVGYVRGIEGRAMADERVVPVLVVRQNIPKGSPSADISSSVELEQIPAKVRAESSVDKLSDLEGLVAAVDLVPGEQLTKARFLSPKALTEQQGIEVPKGLLEMTVALEASRVVGGQILPGDTVAVLGSFSDGVPKGENGDDAEGGGPTTHVLLHKVLVTDLRTETVNIAPPEEDAAPAEGGGGGIPGTQIYVTLALDAPSVERVVHTAEFGTLWLAAEPEDASEGGTRIQRTETIYEETESR